MLLFRDMLGGDMQSIAVMHRALHYLLEGVFHPKGLFLRRGLLEGSCGAGQARPAPQEGAEGDFEGSGAPWGGAVGGDSLSPPLHFRGQIVFKETPQREACPLQKSSVFP